MSLLFFSNSHAKLVLKMTESPFVTFGKKARYSILVDDDREAVIEAFNRCMQHTNVSADTY